MGLLRTLRNLFYGVVLCTTLFVGIPGNVLVIAAVRRKRLLRSTTNYLLANVAAADLATIVFAIICGIPYLFTLDNFPDIFCKIFYIGNLPVTTTSASTLTLAILAIERYQAVIHPLQDSYKLREDTVKYAIVASWIISLGVTLPLYVFSVFENGECSHKYVNYKTYIIIAFSLVIFIPCLVMLFCYGCIVKELYFKNSVAPQNISAAEEAAMRQKLFKRSACVTVVFVSCFLPVAIIHTLRLYIGVKTDIRNIAFAIYFLDAAINPLIYSCQSSNFRQAFIEIIKDYCNKARKRVIKKNRDVTHGDTES
ncbi:predicted protein [Nematostella vectensis]|uniref:G-protein coupled receptors family 1 profile domain-containing protein n=1 Tax=Nematostella vectensis TaxID=45351 RepID=A7T1I9_NEMVE|nr:alpha-1D adrenergic receptor [Nematostella vectensis]EDO30180.1 predicted protein [Nematostella vectensis]|eukprot:XP_001622280.1 hypothetical protein NEMVEDRAFT_v1g220946 [Nematostella vectensis]